mmetsp:Transcript_16101/g.40790  ORF Transcript_16101/g.40790 Transcript_16101/m.40790 type:complete len:228 (+) Transcript_16101:94-777(+)
MVERCGEKSHTSMQTERFWAAKAAFMDEMYWLASSERAWTTRIRASGSVPKRSLWSCTARLVRQSALERAAARLEGPRREPSARNALENSRRLACNAEPSLPLCSRLTSVRAVPSGHSPTTAASFSRELSLTALRNTVMLFSTVASEIGASVGLAPFAAALSAVCELAAGASHASSSRSSTTVTRVGRSASIFRAEATRAGGSGVAQSERTPARGRSIGAGDRAEPA